MTRGHGEAKPRCRTPAARGDAGSSPTCCAPAVASSPTARFRAEHAHDLLRVGSQSTPRNVVQPSLSCRSTQQSRPRIPHSRRGLSRERDGRSAGICTFTPGLQGDHHWSPWRAKSTRPCQLRSPRFSGVYPPPVIDPTRTTSDNMPRVSPTGATRLFSLCSPNAGARPECRMRGGGPATGPRRRSRTRRHAGD